MLQVSTNIRIKALLEQNGITQRDIARQLKKRPAHISQVISGKIKTSPAIQDYISELIDVDANLIWPCRKETS